EQPKASDVTEVFEDFFCDDLGLGEAKDHVERQEEVLDDRVRHGFLIEDSPLLTRCLSPTPSSISADSSGFSMSGAYCKSGRLFLNSSPCPSAEQEHVPENAARGRTRVDEQVSPCPSSVEHKRSVEKQVGSIRGNRRFLEDFASLYNHINIRQPACGVSTNSTAGEGCTHGRPVSK
ncbi:unnamed protein product, partial [Amoebophrya sp. A25]